MSVRFRSATLKGVGLKASERHRRHVEDIVRGLDVDCRTEKKGSPYQLVVAKNRKSYEARCEERRKDLEAIATLSAAGRAT